MFSMMSRFHGDVFEDIARAAVRAQRFAGFLYWQKYARMGVPQYLRRHRTVQRQILCHDLDISGLVDGLLFLHSIPSNRS